MWACHCGSADCFDALAWACDPTIAAPNGISAFDLARGSGKACLQAFCESIANAERRRLEACPKASARKLQRAI